MQNQKFIELRKEKNFSQSRLAEKMYVPIPTIRKWEYGLSFPSTSDMRKMAELFEVTEDIIISIFKPQQTKVAEQKENAFKMHDILLKLFWGCNRIEYFIQFAYLFSSEATMGVICCGDYIFPFTKVIAREGIGAVLFADSSDNYIVITGMNTIEIEPISAEYDVFTFDMIINCPIFPTDLQYLSDSFQQNIRLSFFNR